MADQGAQPIVAERVHFRLLALGFLVAGALILIGISILISRPAGALEPLTSATTLPPVLSTTPVNSVVDVAPTIPDLSPTLTVPPPAVVAQSEIEAVTSVVSPLPLVLGLETADPATMVSTLAAPFMSLSAPPPTPSVSDPPPAAASTQPSAPVTPAPVTTPLSDFSATGATGPVAPSVLQQGGHASPVRIGALPGHRSSTIFGPPLRNRGSPGGSVILHGSNFVGSTNASTAQSPVLKMPISSAGSVLRSTLFDSRSARPD